MAKRKYQALEFMFNKRMSGNWQLGGSVVYSKLYGTNYSGGGPNDLVNKENARFVDADRPLVIKLYGTIKLPGAFYASGHYYHYDGTPVARTLTVYFPSKFQGYSPYYVSATVYAEKPGKYRNPGTDNFDLRIEKELSLKTIGLHGRFKASVDIFNVFGNTSRNIYWVPSGYIYADGRYAPLTTYGKVYGFSGTRSFFFNLRYSF